MPSKYDTYTSPLAERNASPEMLRLWSPREKFNTWRRIWLAVAEAQHELTANTPTPLVTKEQVEELRAVVARGITDEEMANAEKYERDLRHDVMAHVHALGDSCPKAKGIIHLGMTSQDVNDNAELRTLAWAMNMIVGKTERVVLALAEGARQWRSLPTLAFTHYQAAQPTTVGRRFAQWAYELALCSESLSASWMRIAETRRGLRGATGTQASYLELLDRDSSKVDELEARFYYRLEEHGDFPTEGSAAEVVASWAHREETLARQSDEMNGAAAPKFRMEAARLRSVPSHEAIAEFSNTIRANHTLPLVTQTYPRVIDTFILADLASTASVLHKIATDIRLLASRKELDEPFESKQIGSSAMPYKRNPMRCERICGLTRFVMNLVGNAYDTAATQWLERTLDDSSNRRLSLPEAFLALDGALDLMHNVASGLIVHEATIRRNLMAELPFMATENILMACVKLGADRQRYHELIRRHAQAAGLRVKQEGLDNDLLDRLKADPAFHPPSLRAELDWSNLLDPMQYIGRSVEQTERFIKEVVEPLREQYGEAIAKLGDSAPKV